MQELVVGMNIFKMDFTQMVPLVTDGCMRQNSHPPLKKVGGLIFDIFAKYFDTCSHFKNGWFHIQKNMISSNLVCPS